MLSWQSNIWSTAGWIGFEVTASGDARAVVLSMLAANLKRLEDLVRRFAELNDGLCQARIKADGRQKNFTCHALKDGSLSSALARNAAADINALLQSRPSTGAIDLESVEKAQ